MMVLTDTTSSDTELARGTRAGSCPSGSAPVRDGGRRCVAHSAPQRVRTVNRERPLNQRAATGAPRHVATTACSVRPAARPLRFLMLLGLATAITVVLLSMIGSVNGAAEVPRSTTVTQVHAGETLWDVARRSAPASDAAEVVERIRELNPTSSAALRPGQPLLVPGATRHGA